MRLGHPGAEVLQGAGGERFCEPENTVVFRHHMAASAEDGVGEVGAVALEVFQGDITEGADMGQVGAKQADAFLALGAADIVFTTGESVFHAGVADHQAKSIGKGDVGGVEGSAVEEEGMTGSGMGGDELVHDAALGTGEMVLGPLTGQGETAEVGGMTGGGEEGEAEAHFQGGGGAESGAQGDFTGEAEVGALEAVAVGFQFHGDAAEVIAPMVLEGGAGVIEVDGDGLLQVIGVGVEETVGAGGEGSEEGEMDGSGEDEAVVVIGVFADEVDPTGSAGEEGGGAMEDSLECVDGLGRRHVRSLECEGGGGNAGGVVGVRAGEHCGGGEGARRFGVGCGCWIDTF